MYNHSSRKNVAVALALSVLFSILLTVRVGILANYIFDLDIGSLSSRGDGRTIFTNLVGFLISYFFLTGFFGSIYLSRNKVKLTLFIVLPTFLATYIIWGLDGNKWDFLIPFSIGLSIGIIGIIVGFITKFLYRKLRRT